MIEEAGLEEEIQPEDIVIEINLLHATKPEERHGHSWPRYNGPHVHKWKHKERVGWRVKLKDGIVLGSGYGRDMEDARGKAKELVRRILEKVWEA